MTHIQQKRVRQFGFQFLNDYSVIKIIRDEVPTDLLSSYDLHYRTITDRMYAEGTPWDISRLWRWQISERVHAESWLGAYCEKASFEELCMCLCIVPPIVEPIVISVMQEHITAEFILQHSFRDWLRLEVVAKLPENNQFDHRVTLAAWSKKAFEDTISMLDPERFDELLDRLKTPVSLRRGGSDLWTLFK